jgi:hypothetical protein
MDDDIIARIWDNLGGRIGGPLSLRLFMQPMVASILAIRAGMQDAGAGRPAYFWAIITRPGSRRELLREGWRAVAKIFALAITFDLVYQLTVFGRVYPSELLIVAFLLACVPYLLVRGPTNRIAAFFRRPAHPKPAPRT